MTFFDFFFFFFFFFFFLLMCMVYFVNFFQLKGSNEFLKVNHFFWLW